MTSDMDIGHHGRGSMWRMFGWGFAALLLLFPLVAMQFTSEVNWTAGDFLVAALMIGVVGLALELVVRFTRNSAYRAAAGAALAAGLLILWANGAVGMIGDEGNSYNLLFLGVIGVALLGAIAARFRPVGMALAMGAATVAHLGVALGGLSADFRGAIVSAAFALPWLLSAALFRRAAREKTA